MALQTAFRFGTNEIFSTLANMIISQQVFADNISFDGSLVERFKTDGSMYGDTKLFYATDALKSNEWNQDADLNILQTHRPADPKVQSITIDAFRQIPLTVDQYMTKRAFSDEYTFSQFNSVMLAWMGITKKLYENTIFNTYVGVTSTSTGKQSQTVTLATGASGAANVEAENRINGALIAKKIADILGEVKDPILGKKYNDYGFYRNYNAGDFVAVWNLDIVNTIEKIDLPTVFHKEGLVEKIGEYTLPGDYFGTIITSTNVSSYSASTPAAGKPINSSTGAYTPGSDNANGKICSTREVTIGTTHIFAGEEIPSGTIIAASDNLASNTIAYETCYIVDAKVICKLIHKNALKFMSAFETGTEFFNPKNLSTNHYLTWGYSDPFDKLNAGKPNSLPHNAGYPGGIRLLNYPYITVSKA